MPVTITFSGYFYNSVTNICFDNEAELNLNSNNHIQQNDKREGEKCSIERL
jgi:hypothetical protein